MSFAGVPNDSEQSRDTNPKEKILELIFYTFIAFVLIAAGVYQLKFKLANETTLQGVLLRIGCGAGLIVVGQSLCLILEMQRECAQPKHQN